MTTSQWQNPPYHNSQNYFDLCAQSKPQDFYVAVKGNSEYLGGDTTLIAITPKAYFDQHHYSWDQTMFISHLLPDDLSEASECVYECDRDADEVLADLLARGFLQNDAFAQEVEEDYE